MLKIVQIKSSKKCSVIPVLDVSTDLCAVCLGGKSRNSAIIFKNFKNQQFEKISFLTLDSVK